MEAAPDLWLVPHDRLGFSVTVVHLDVTVEPFRVLRGRISADVVARSAAVAIAVPRMAWRVALAPAVPTGIGESRRTRGHDEG
jgi:hypothetical protein